MEKEENILGTEKIGKLLMKFSIPCIISLLVSSLYNIVDQIFIGWGVGYLGNGATNVVFPLTMIGLSFALMFGDGASAFLSLKLGEKKKEDAAKGIGNGIMLSLLFSIVYTILTLIFLPKLLRLFGSTDNLQELAKSYGYIIVCGFPFYMIGQTLNSMIRADGSPKFAMTSMLTGAILNTILDPIFIFIFKWGVQGAAATIIVLLILAGISISMLSGDNGLLNRTTEARERTIHANVFEQLQLEELAYLTDKSTSRDTSTLIGYLQSKSIIGNEIGEDTGKYQVNVTVLLGSKQSLGNGDATSELKDVYMLEKQNVSSGSIVNTKVATTQPIRIAATTTSQVTYKVVYYGNNTSSVANLGNLSDSIKISNPSAPTGDTTDYTETLYNYYKDMNYEQVEGSNTIDGTSATWLFYGDSTDNYPDYIEYKGGVYKVVYTDSNTDKVKEVVKVSSNADFSTLGIYQIDGTNYLITPNGETGIVHPHQTFSGCYYLKEKDDEEGVYELDFDRPFTSGYRDGSNFYDDSGALGRVATDA